MKRLTELYTDLEIEIHNSEPEARHLEKGNFRPKNNVLLSDCVQKLGQIEDIEDELGIDLITMFKILEAKECYFEEDGQCFIVGIDKKGVILMPKKFPYGECEHTVPFKELGKTWALTKEELENEKKRL